MQVKENDSSWGRGLVFPRVGKKGLLKEITPQRNQNK